jgi:uncharacterized protein YkwD
MLNRNPSNSSNVINSYRKRRLQKGPFLIYGAVALVIIGAIMLVVWLASPGKFIGNMLATDTPTPTLTFTPTSTNTPTMTSTVTETPTVTLTFTPSGPQPYTIQEGESLESIAKKFNLGDDGSLIIYYANQAVMEENGGVIFVGQTITIPPPGSTLPTTTPIPADLPRGRLIEYRVLPGDTLAGIAAKFNSLADNIIETNKIEDANALQVGQILQVPVNLVTATATLPATSTPVTPTIEGQPTAAPATAAAANATPAASSQCTFQENSTYVTELLTLINSERTKTNLPALTTDPKLTQAAKAHAVDMTCNNYVSHRGEQDGSTQESRVSQAGFTASLVAETIYASKTVTPQEALNWWLTQTDDKAGILNANTTQVGIAYVKSEQNLFGGYFVVVAAKP